MRDLNKLRPLALALAAIGGLSLSACNTIRGAGEDIEQGGEAISGAAQETEDNLTDGNPKTP